MAISVPGGAGNLTTAAVNSGTTINLDKPPNAVNGDLLVAGIWARSNTAPFTTIPAGWTEVAPAGTELTAAGIMRWYYKLMTAVSSEPAQFVWSGGTSGRNTGVCFRVTGFNTGSILDISGVEATPVGATTTPTLTLPDMTTTAGSDLLLAMQGASVAAGGVAGAFVPPSSMTTLGAVNTTTGSGESYLEVDQQTLGAAGAVGTRVFTRANPLSTGLGYMIAIKASVSSIVSGGNPVAAPNPVDAGATCTLTIPLPTGGSGTPFTYAVDWGDGSTTAAQSSRTPTHAYAGVTPGSADIVTQKTITVTINNS